MLEVSRVNYNWLSLSRWPGSVPPGGSEWCSSSPDKPDRVCRALLLLLLQTLPSLLVSQQARVRVEGSAGGVLTETQVDRMEFSRAAKMNNCPLRGNSGLHWPSICWAVNALHAAHRIVVELTVRCCPRLAAVMFRGWMTTKMLQQRDVSEQAGNLRVLDVVHRAPRVGDGKSQKRTGLARHHRHAECNRCAVRAPPGAHLASRPLHHRVAWRHVISGDVIRGRRLAESTRVDALQTDDAHRRQSDRH